MQPCLLKAIGGTVGNVITRIRGGWRKSKDLVSFLASRGFEENSEYIWHAYIILCYMEVRCDQLKRKMGSELRRMLQGYLDLCAILGLRVCPFGWNWGQSSHLPKFWQIPPPFTKSLPLPISVPYH